MTSDLFSIKTPTQKNTMSTRFEPNIYLKRECEKKSVKNNPSMIEYK